MNNITISSPQEGENEGNVEMTYSFSLEEDVNVGKMVDERPEDGAEVVSSSFDAETYSLIPQRGAIHKPASYSQAEEIDTQLDNPPLHALHHQASYPQMSAVTEDAEGRPVDFTWDLLHPAFIVPFRRGTDILLCVGLALKPRATLRLYETGEQDSDTQVLMSLEFFSFEKKEYLGETKRFQPFEFIAFEGPVPRVTVLEEGDSRDLCLENTTHQFLFSLTDMEGTWKCSPLKS